MHEGAEDPWTLFGEGAAIVSDLSKADGSEFIRPIVPMFACSRSGKALVLEGDKVVLGRVERPGRAADDEGEEGPTFRRERALDCDITGAVEMLLSEPVGF